MNTDKSLISTGDTRTEKEATLEMFGLTVRDDGLIEYRDGEIAECPHEEEKITADKFAIVPRTNQEPGFVLIKPTDYAFSAELARESRLEEESK